MRVGCQPLVPWHRLWGTLQAYVTHLYDMQRALSKEDNGEGGLKTPSGLYVAISVNCMQAVDINFLMERWGFRFHHYRSAGHGASGSTPGSPASTDNGAAEFVYYCWPGDAAKDKVPSYATSIEGTSGASRPTVDIASRRG